MLSKRLHISFSQYLRHLLYLNCPHSLISYFRTHQYHNHHIYINLIRYFLFFWAFFICIALILISSFYFIAFLDAGMNFLIIAFKD